MKNAKLRNAARTTFNRSGRCEDCEYSVGVKGESAPILSCRNKAGGSGRMWVVEANGHCGHFTRDKEILAPELVRALAEGAKLIPLTQDKFAIVDAEDYDHLCQYKWYAKKGSSTYYAARTVRLHKECEYASLKQILMHRVITKAPPHMLVDHRNHNGLDNRRSKLRLCTGRENSQNSRPRRGTSSRYKGVSWDKKENLYKAYIGHKGKRYHLGYFNDEIEAAKAYDKKARELFGQFAYLNFPEES